MNCCWRIFITRISCKICENIVTNSKFMPSVTFSSDVQWVGLESLLGSFWSLGLKFDTPGLAMVTFRNNPFDCFILSLFVLLFSSFFPFPDGIDRFDLSAFYAQTHFYSRHAARPLIYSPVLLSIIFLTFTTIFSYSFS